MELIVIFVGVLMAFAAENWREERSFRADAHESLRLMLDDLASDSAEFQGLAESLEARKADLAWLVAQRDRDEVPADSIAAALWAFNSQTRAAKSRTAWEGMENANRLAWIEPDTLRAAIGQYYQERHALYDYWADLADRSGEDLILEDLFRHVEMLPGRDPGDFWPAESRRLPLASSWREFRDDRVLQNKLVSLGRVMDFLAGFAMGASEEATALMVAIRAESP